MTNTGRFIFAQVSALAVTVLFPLRLSAVVSGSEERRSPVNCAASAADPSPSLYVTNNVIFFPLLFSEWATETV